MIFQAPWRVFTIRNGQMLSLQSKLLHGRLVFTVFRTNQLWSNFGSSNLKFLPSLFAQPVVRSPVPQGSERIVLDPDAQQASPATALQHRASPVPAMAARVRTSWEWWMIFGVLICWGENRHMISSARENGDENGSSNPWTFSSILMFPFGGQRE